MRALMYALGGGWGHLNRAVALARHFSPLPILTNSAYAGMATLPHGPGSIPNTTLDCLIVDTFPRGLGGEFAETIDSLARFKVLVARDLVPEYVADYGLREFVQRHYDLILVPGASEGEAFRDLPNAVVTAPWILEVSGKGDPGILVCASGNADELGWYGEVARLLEARCVAPVCPPGCPAELWIQHWPAVDLIAAADVVIGSAGYNTVYECLAYGVPLVSRPWPRKYDRQWLRAKRAGVRTVHEPEEAAAAAREELVKPRRKVEFRNGAREAAEILRRLVNQSHDGLE